MALKKKNVREIIGFTFLDHGSDPENWYKNSIVFCEAATILHGSSYSATSIAYYYNAGLSIELILKAIILAKSKTFETNHRLNELCGNAEIKLSDDQMLTLELLSEVITWSGRYPAPKKEGQWDNYYDVILEKHIVKEKDGSTFRTLAHKGRFPSLDNYRKIWKACEAGY